MNIHVISRRMRHWMNGTKTDSVIARVMAMQIFQNYQLWRISFRAIHTIELMSFSC